MSFLLIVRASIVLEGEYFLLGAKIFVVDLHFAGRQHLLCWRLNYIKSRVRAIIQRDSWLAFYGETT